MKYQIDKFKQRKKNLILISWMHMENYWLNNNSFTMIKKKCVSIFKKKEEKITEYML